MPHSIFGAETRPNRMVIRLQPDEDIKLTLMNKAPGLTAEGTHLQALDLSLSLTKAFDGNGNKPSRRRIAYERLILDALNGNNAQFVRRDEVEAAWIYVDGIVERWKEAGMKPQVYQAGTVGPVSAYTLMDRDGRMWND